MTNNNKIVLMSIFIVSLCWGCAPFAHWQDYQQQKKIKELEKRIDTLENNKQV